MGSVGIGPGILNLDARWRWLVSFMVQPPYSWGKCIQCQLDRRLGRI